MSELDRRIVTLEDAYGEYLSKGKGEVDPERYRKYEDDPVGFAEDVLGVRLWSKQRDLAELVVGNRLVYALSANGVGKTLAAAVLTLWWLFCRGPSMVVSIAATEKQLREQLWGEIRSLHMKAGLQGERFTQGLRISEKDGWRAIGFNGST